MWPKSGRAEIISECSFDGLGRIEQIARELRDLRGDDRSGGAVFADAGIRPSVRVETPIGFVACRLARAGAKNSLTRHTFTSGSVRREQAFRDDCTAYSKPERV